VDDVRESKEEKTKPDPQLIPDEQDGLFGFYAGKLAISGDIECPSVPYGHWKRLSR
jgi:hypothetical protein